MQLPGEGAVPAAWQPRPSNAENGFGEKIKLMGWELQLSGSKTRKAGRLPPGVLGLGWTPSWAQPFMGMVPSPGCSPCAGLGVPGPTEDPALRRTRPSLAKPFSSPGSPLCRPHLLRVVAALIQSLFPALIPSVFASDTGSRLLRGLGPLGEARGS